MFIVSPDSLSLVHTTCIVASVDEALHTEDVSDCDAIATKKISLEPQGY